MRYSSVDEWLWVQLGKQTIMIETWVLIVPKTSYHSCWGLPLSTPHFAHFFHAPACGGQDCWNGGYGGAGVDRHVFLRLAKPFTILVQQVYLVIHCCKTPVFGTQNTALCRNSWLDTIFGTQSRPNTNTHFAITFLECQNACKALWLCQSFLLSCRSFLLLFVRSVLCDLNHFSFLQQDS
jgi:hypothetical protein